MRLILVLGSTIGLVTVGCSAGGGLSSGSPMIFSNRSGSLPLTGATSRIEQSAAPRQSHIESVIVYTLSKGATHNKALAFVTPTSI